MGVVDMTLKEDIEQLRSDFEGQCSKCVSKQDEQDKRWSDTIKAFENQRDKCLEKQDKQWSETTKAFERLYEQVRDLQSYLENKWSKEYRDIIKQMDDQKLQLFLEVKKLELDTLQKVIPVSVKWKIFGAGILLLPSFVMVLNIIGSRAHWW